MKKRMLFQLALLGLFVALLVTSCSFFGETDAADTYLQLNVGSGPASRGIGVDYYEVTSLDLEVRSENGTGIEWFHWEAWEGTQTYMVPVPDAGSYYIRVTHHGTNGSDTVEASEMAGFEIAPMRITVIDVVPGSIGVIRVNGEELPPPVPCEFVGTWFAGSVDFSAVGLPMPVDIVVTVTPDGIWELLIYEMGTENLLPGSWRARILRCGDGVVAVDFFESYHPPDGWVPDPGYFLEFAYEMSPAGDVFTGWVDFDMNGTVDAIIEMRPYSPPPPPCMAEMVGVWFGYSLPLSDSGFVDARMTVNPDGSFESLLVDSFTGELQQMSMRGIVLNCVGDVMVGESWEVYMPPDWVPYWMEFRTPFTLAGDLFTLYQDFDMDGNPDAVWDLHRGMP